MAHNRFASLELIPASLLLEIEKYLPPIDVVMLIMVCKMTLANAKILDKDGDYEYQSLDFLDVNNRRLVNYRDSNLYPFFNTRINAMYNILKQTGLYILKGQKDIALEMIDDRLLLERVPKIRLQKNSQHVEVHGGCTLYQLALRTYDPEIYEPLGKLIEERFGHQVKVKQFNERFPEGYKRKNYRPVFDSLIKTIAADLTIDFDDAISWNIMNDTTWEALKALETSLAADVHFDLQSIMDFIEAYEENRSEFTDKKQDDFYWRCGFGILEKFMPYFVAMVLNEQNDFWNVMEGKKQVTARATLLRNGLDFFDLSLGASHWALNGVRAGGAWGARGAVARSRGVRVKSFCQVLTEKLGEQLKRQLQQPTNPYQQEVNHQESGCRIF